MTAEELKKEILEKAEAVYREQKATGIIHPMFCNFSILEKACGEYFNS